MFFTCKFCNSKFQTERNLEKHCCESKAKTLFLKTKKGQSTLYYYQEWRKMCGYKVNEEDSFLNSKYFKSFINFLDFANKKLIPDKKGYMKLMCEKKVAPSHWTNDIFYDYYIENFDKLYTPLKQVDLSIRYIEELANILNCEMNKVVRNIEVIELMKLISARKISPWFILFHEGFKDLIRYRLTNEEKILIETIISVDQWKKKFKEKPDIVKKIKDLLNYLKL